MRIEFDGNGEKDRGQNGSPKPPPKDSVHGKAKGRKSQVPGGEFETSTRTEATKRENEAAGRNCPLPNGKSGALLGSRRLLETRVFILYKHTFPKFPTARIFGLNIFHDFSTFHILTSLILLVTLFHTCLHLV